MKRVIKSLIISMISGGVISSCQLEPYEIPAEEAYTREFIKQFGVIDKNQDWNIAARKAVTVNPGSAEQVKVYAYVGNTRYIFANYQGVQGTQTLEFDLPEGIEDIIVRVNGVEKTAKVGETVDFSGVKARTVFSGEDPVTVKKMDAVMTIDKTEANRAVTVALTEQRNQDLAYNQTNLEKEGVTVGFYAKAKEFDLYPEYWVTSKAVENIIGIYIYVNSNTTGATAVTLTNGDTKYIKRIPILQDPNELVKKISLEEKNFLFGEGGFDLDRAYQALSNKYPESYLTSDGSQKNQYGNQIPSGTYIFYDKENNKYYELDVPNENQFPLQVRKHLVECFPDEIVFHEEYGGYIRLVTQKTEPLTGIQNISEFSFEKLECTGIHVEFKEEMSFGFYIQQGDGIMYSEHALNTPVSFKLNENTSDTKKYDVAYVATFKDNQPDEQGNTKRYLCFEDWYKGTNFDLNDMVFRVYGLDDTPGNIVPDNPDENEEKPFAWLVACEDLGNTGDIDFNDIVFKVEHTSGDDYAIFTPLATGATLESYVYYLRDGATEVESVFTSLPESEIHKLLGGSAPNFINTTDNRGSDRDRRPIKLNVGKNFSMAYIGEAGKDEQNMGGFVIKTFGREKDTTTGWEAATYIGGSKIGEAPMMICLPYEYEENGEMCEWAWPKERVNIKEAYHEFEQWVKDSSHTDWYKHPVGDKVVSGSKVTPVTKTN